MELLVLVTGAFLTAVFLTGVFGFLAVLLFTAFLATGLEGAVCLGCFAFAVEDLFCGHEEGIFGDMVNEGWQASAPRLLPTDLHGQAQVPTPTTGQRTPEA